jgi:hypothetical protein
MSFKHYFLKIMTCICLLLASNKAAFAQADSVYWTFGTSGSATQYAAFSSHIGVPAANCVADTGNPAVQPLFSGYTPEYLTAQFWGNGYPNPSGEPCIRNSCITGGFTTSSSYISFLVSPQPGYTVTINAIHFAGGRNNSTGPQQYTVRTSADNYTANAGTGTLAIQYGTSKKSHTGLNITGTSGTPIEVRVYGHNGFQSTPSGNLFIDDIVIYYTLVASASITTDPVSGTMFCAGDAVNVPFTTSGTFNTGNIFTAELSDANGSFATPLTIGTVAGTTSGTINATIPVGTAAGTGYRIRVVGSNPVILGTDNGTNLTISAPVTPSVSVTANPSGPVCSGTPVTFTASPVNGGNTPVYQWFVNGSLVGSNSNTYTSSSLTNNDVVTAVLTTSETCYTDLTDTSNAITMSVTPTVTPDVSIIASSTNICPTSSVTFTATPVNGGNTPGYQWFVNGTPVGTNSDTYTGSNFLNNDVITVVLTTSETCYTNLTDTSNAISLTVTNSVTPALTISSTGDTICAGSNITFTANPSGGGTTPVIEWFVNGSSVGNGGTFSSTTIADNDVVTAVLTSSEPCASVPTDTSNAVTVTVDTLVTPSVTVTPNPGSTVDSGTVVTFTANPTNGGTNPVYQWYKNGVPVGTGGNTYVDSTLATDDSITVELISSDPCATIPDTSAPVVMIVNPVSVSYVYADAMVQIYPNPSNESFTLVLSPVSGAATVEITDVTGRLVYSNSYKAQAGQLKEQISLYGQAQGFYLIKVKANDAIYTEKLQILH